MEETVSNLKIGTYKAMQETVKALGDRVFDCDHIPSMATIKAYAKLRYGLTLPTDSLGEVHREYLVEELSHTLLQRTVFWQELGNRALTWILPFEVHQNYSRTYQSRCAKALESDWIRFVDELGDDRNALGLSFDDIEYLREPSRYPDQVQRIMNMQDALTGDTIGVRYLRIAIESDVAALREPIMEHYAESRISRKIMHAEIDHAQSMFLGHIPTLDKALQGRIEAEQSVRHAVSHALTYGNVIQIAPQDGSAGPPQLRDDPEVVAVIAKHGGVLLSPGRQIVTPAQASTIEHQTEATIDLP